MIRAIITDFDGTLVDTFTANLRAYQKAFQQVGRVLTEEEYKKCFGYRFEQFMVMEGIMDREITNQIQELKKQYYPQYFNYLKPNTSLIELIRSFRSMGGISAIASTARKDNLTNALEYLNITSIFDCVLSGADVEKGKPDPEIYLTAMNRMCILPEETLIFEDSPVGIEAAKLSGAHYMKVII